MMPKEMKRSGLRTSRRGPADDVAQLLDAFGSRLLRRLWLMVAVTWVGILGLYAMVLLYAA